MVASTSLDNNITKLAVSSINNNENRRKNVKIWTFKQKRAYHRVLSGYRFSIFLSKPLRFFTLTTAIGVKRNINDDFQILKKRIGRKFGHLEYFKVKTSEGNGVLHVIYRGPYIPQKWLSRHWNDIRGSPIVDIRAVKRYHCTYVVNQYLAGQSGFERYSSTYHWVYPRYVTWWCFFKRIFGSKCLEKWKQHLSGKVVTFVSKDKYYYCIKPPPNVGLLYKKKDCYVKCVNVILLLCWLSQSYTKPISTIDDFLN